MDVSEVLSHKSLQRYSLDDLKRIVNTSDKQRFSFREQGNTLEIRANQGHSLNVRTSIILIFELQK